MSEFIKMCLVICPIVFFGGFVDSIAGGGGIITIPAYMMVGFPTRLAMGTNKLVASSGAVMASYKYIKNGSVDFKLAGFSIAGALIGGSVGSKLTLIIPDDILKIIVLVALPIVAAFVLLRKDFGQKPTPKELSFKTQSLISSGIGLIMGLYDGLVGPGTGTFMLIAFTGFLGLDLLTSASCAKVSNLASNLTALAVYIINGHVEYAIAIPAAMCQIAGSYIGSRYAIKGGSANVRKVMLVVMVLIFVKLGYDFFAG